MSVLIKGMEMPTDKPARVVINPNGQVFVDHSTWYSEYEAFQVPPHGRLGDLDVLADKHRTMAYENDGRSYSFHTTAKAWVDDAPTIIPAESEGE